MTAALWQWDELVAAAGGVADGKPGEDIKGLGIDSRTSRRGEVFIALKDQRDGHEFVTSAFEKGAAAAVVSTGYRRQAGDGPLIKVDDTLAALEAMARAARARLAPEARVIGVTGSVGKTGTKEMLRGCLSRLGPTHAPEKSFNNHWGVPLTLARMPANTAYGVFEIGMNHAGEITPLTKLVRPHVAIITTVQPVHLGNFASVEAIADAKAEIFAGLEPFQEGLYEQADGTVLAGWGEYAAVLNRDNRYFDRLANRARMSGARIVSFGTRPDCDIRPAHMELHTERTLMQVDCTHGRLTYTVGAPGDHLAMNSLAVVAAVEALGLDFERMIHAVRALADFRAPQGRGAREELSGAMGRILLVDESYNANPASMRAALSALALVPRAAYPRRIAVLGDMLELGEQSEALHAELADAVVAADIDLLFAAGPHMKALFDKIESRRRGAWAAESLGLAGALEGTLHDGDVIMIKGSLGSRMGPLVELVRRHVRGNTK